jgi:hypothetical protein
MGSIRLYKCTARMSRENTPLLPTGEGHRKGLSVIEEVMSNLKVRFTPDSRPPPLHSNSGLDTYDSNTSDDDLLISTKEVVKELRYQDSSKACSMDGIHIRLLKTLAETSFVDVLAALFNSCI